MKRFIVILLVLILVGGGGAGGLIMMGVVPNPFNPEGGGFFSGGSDTADGKKSNFKPPTTALQQVKVADMVVPVIINGRLVRTISITARLVVSKASNKTLVEDNLPRFQSILVRELVPYFQTHFRTNDVVDPTDVKKVLMVQSERIYGELVSDVLLVNVFQQDMGRR
jgi:hypothetical protein